jgi:hypothetical protein
MDDEPDPPVVKCKEAVKHFLTEGVFDGLSGTSFDGRTYSHDQKTHWKVQEHLCMLDCQPGQVKWDQNYAFTFWFKRTAHSVTGFSGWQVLPIFNVRPQEKDIKNKRHDWTLGWGGFPSMMGLNPHNALMFCGGTGGWHCTWPIGEENSGIKGGYRYAWRERWTMPPLNWWRFFGLMVDESGYSLYEFSDPPLKDQNKFHRNERARPDLDATVHGFSRKVVTLSKGSWWGHDINDRAKSGWVARELPRTMYPYPEYEKVWTGFVVNDKILQRYSRHFMPEKQDLVPYHIVDLTYYRLEDHVFTEEEMEALYDKGRSVKDVD